MTAPTLPPEADQEPRQRPSLRARSTRGLGSLRGATKRLGRPRSRRLPPEGFGILAALWAAAIGLAIAAVPMLLAWMASPGTGLTWTAALRMAGLLWVVAQGTPVAIAGVTITLVPWGLAIIPLVLLGYAGGWSARRSRTSTWAHCARLVGAGTIVYAAIVGVVAQTTFEADSRVSLVAAVIHGGVLALVGLGWGAIRASGLLPDPRIPTVFTASVRAGAAAAATILAMGALVAAASLLSHFDDAVTMAQSLGAGLGGGLVLMLLGVAYVPVMVVWSSAYLVGAGVVIAPSVTITPFITATAPADLPPFPLLAALPQQAPVFAWALPAVGVLAGILAGLHIGRSCRAEARLVRLAVAAAAAAVAGLILALFAWLASGALGSAQLASLGPVPATVGVLSAVLVVLGALPSAIVPPVGDRPRLRVAKPTATRAQASEGASRPADEATSDQPTLDDPAPHTDLPTDSH